LSYPLAIIPLPIVFFQFKHRPITANRTLITRADSPNIYYNYIYIHRTVDVAVFVLTIKLLENWGFFFLSSRFDISTVRRRALSSVYRSKNVRSRFIRSKRVCERRRTLPSPAETSMRSVPLVMPRVEYVTTRFYVIASPSFRLAGGPTHWHTFRTNRHPDTRAPPHEVIFTGAGDKTKSSVRSHQ